MFFSRFADQECLKFWSKMLDGDCNDNVIAKTGFLRYWLKSE